MDTGGVSSEEDLPEQFRCPVCTCVPENEIYLCKNGHTVCSVCITNLLECPQCRVSYRTGKVQNRPLESLLDAIPFSCPNKKYGCTEEMRRQDLSKHRSLCKFRNKAFKLCQLIGIKRCEFVTSNVKVEEAIQHVKEHKNIVFQRGQSIRIDMKDFKEVLARQNEDPFFWDPILLELPNGGPVFLILVKANNEGKGYTTQSISCSCVIMANPDVDAKSYSLEFTVPSYDENVAPSMSWKTSAIQLANARNYLEMGPMKISTAYLIDNLLEPAVSNCFLHLSISKLLNENEVVEDSKHDVLMMSVDDIKPEVETVQVRRVAHVSFPDELPGPSRSASQSQPKPESENNVRFDAVTCDGCNQCPIVNERYKCLQCVNYDLCRTCYFARKIHTTKGHVFGYISSLEKSLLANEMGNWRKRAILGLKAARRISVSSASNLDESDSRQPQCVSCEMDTDSGYLCLECNETIHAVCRRCWDQQKGHSDHINVIFCNTEQYMFALGHIKNGRILKFLDDINKSSDGPTREKLVLDNWRKSMKEILKKRVTNDMSSTDKRKMEALGNAPETLGVEIVDELVRSYGGVNSIKSKTKYISLYYCLNDEKNSIFLEILKGNIKPYDLVRMTPDEMAPHELAERLNQP